MIKVVVLLDGPDGEQLLAEMEITREKPVRYNGVDCDDEFSEYLAVVAVDDGENDRYVSVLALHERKTHNVLSLVKNILNELSDDQLKLKGPINGEAGTPDLARGQLVAGFEVQRWAGRLRDYRSTFRGEQPLEPGDDA